ncbi:MAG: 1-deoxy-D-xylulose-5-phosphate reductoisomerase [Actinobacteria bacterium]|jgi:1-deoxy-D-xylulose-5-phosphate reductoisomerase|nr:1-deoxy-D-xylulose-5-phosphate reductoisomerase [Micrococcales bacterium]MCB0903349.1 1-deoxy-D-xylulose-5-phosphate reductoisomerase [Actinomycetota bacterium]HRV67449.1 1-deoxy-D-xylulose-5-phosphate reductoisomerase [Candidatus Nanopelagicales bacterium]MCB9428222.1 1-deoxy-D-xylulose-5-phosphate reductoisomerase [Actinomycetota bacterium]HPE12304.1 1-deoxy-D-xylulose-5-phosphate reductoisomerase [Actinomycetota bacterium]
MPRDVVILGSTGSIGTQALDVIRRNPGRFRVVGLAAGGSDVAALAAQVDEFSVAHVAVADPTAADALTATGATVHTGPDAATEVAGLDVHTVLNGITGAVGLRPTLAALEAGSVLALANKESLIIGGQLVTAVARPGQIVPVDSEHSAMAQCLRSGRAEEVRKLILTASGGPFRGRARDQLQSVTLEQALAHPTWDMGPVVTINSATLMNKGLELIEAHLLFGVPLDAIEVVVHPQSIVHSMVEFVDGSTIAQASPPDMRLPIALGMAWPDRVPDAAPACDWSSAATWEFFPLDDEAFPAVGLASRAAAAGGIAPAVLNAANEQAVAAFREARIGFLGITELVDRVMQETLPSGANRGNRVTLEDVLDADAWARGLVRGLIEEDV